ncbi:MAG TPA: alpha/beta hydrolase-fold protein [Opitutaceae bacterium]|jgi:enterochelin esterase-like enzyme
MRSWILFAAALAPNAPIMAADTSATPLSSMPAIVQRIQAELSGPLTEDSRRHPGVPHGEMLQGTLADSAIYPGTENPFSVYVPAQYDPARPACLLVRLDGIGEEDPIVLDNLIAAGELPVIVEVGISSGVVWRAKGSAAYRWNRSYEFDSMNSNFPRFVLDELLPRVESLRTRAGKAIRLSRSANDRAVTGDSTGGIGSFTLAWERPDAFSRVYSVIGTFVSMRGGNDYPALIRKTEPKPIRIFLEDGSTDAWNPLFGSWYEANLGVESALSFAGYDVQHAWGVHGHDGRAGAVIFPDVLRWLWRGWPAPVAAGQSRNDMLGAILLPGQGWERVPGAHGSIEALACDQGGRVTFFDRKNHRIERIAGDGATTVLAPDAPDVGGEAYGPGGTLYATVPSLGEVVAFDSRGGTRTLARGIEGGHILAAPSGGWVVAEPGRHADERVRLWLVHTDGSKSALDSGLRATAGISYSPDRNLFFAAERGFPRVVSYVVRPDGSLADREPFYWLHTSGPEEGPATGDLVTDLQGSLYVATPLGVQVCDRNGRVRAILWLPQPCGPVEGLCWGGRGFDTLYATDGRSIFRRRMKVAGFPPWSTAAALPKDNAG